MVAKRKARSAKPTYEAMPVQAAAALQLQRIIREENLLDNVSRQGAYLEQRLRAVLGNHPNVGDIRGKGLFWGLEFVKDKARKESFDPKLGIAQKILDLAISPRLADEVCMPQHDCLPNHRLC